MMKKNDEQAKLIQKMQVKYKADFIFSNTDGNPFQIAFFLLTIVRNV